MQTTTMRASLRVNAIYPRDEFIRLFEMMVENGLLEYDIPNSWSDDFQAPSRRKHALPPRMFLETSTPVLNGKAMLHDTWHTITALYCGSEDDRTMWCRDFGLFSYRLMCGLNIHEADVEFDDVFRFHLDDSDLAEYRHNVEKSFGRKLHEEGLDDLDSKKSKINACIVDLHLQQNPPFDHLYAID